MVELLGVRKTFDAGRPSEVRAVRGIDLAFESGHLTVLKGPSGSGKTTLLTLIGCLARPTEGRVRVEGLDVSALPERFLAAIRRRTFGFVFQRHELVRGLSALDNVLVPALPVGAPRRALLARTTALFTRLGIEARMDEKVERLSGGEAQRVAIARALVNEPHILIADEPTASLDTDRAASLIELLDGLKREGRTIIVSSHDPLVHGSPIVDRVVALRDGHLVEGT
ncbi:ABC transporter ATP-binding protein [Myxococcota bacterium]|nr:ABC transporter ATP-binding protein [Myxococcota bacterium]